MSEEVCDHAFRSDGVAYRDGKHPLPGSGARAREYFDAYVCKRCLERRLKPLGAHGNTYGKILFGARPVQTGEEAR